MTRYQENYQGLPSHVYFGFIHKYPLEYPNLLKVTNASNANVITKIIPNNQTVHNYE